MISWAVTFLVIALIAAVLGFSGIAGTAVNIAWMLVVVGIVLALCFVYWAAARQSKHRPGAVVQHADQAICTPHVAGANFLQRGSK